MIRVFIYHSRLDRLQYLQKIFVAYFQKERHTYRLTACGKYDDAMSHLESSAKEGDIFFFDFSDYKKGILLSSYLREQNFMASWVYVDGKTEDLYRAMLLRPSACLSDSENARDALAALQRLEQYHQLLQKKYDFDFKCEGEYVRLPFEEISYFESSAKRVVLRQSRSEKQYSFSAKLDDIAAQLPACFLRCHQSYLVNMHMIRRLNTQTHVFWLYSNEEIPISRRNYQEAKTRYQQFLAGRA